VTRSVPDGTVDDAFTGASKPVTDLRKLGHRWNLPGVMVQLQLTLDDSDSVMVAVTADEEAEILAERAM
jgi:hypothetical protein